MIDIFMTFGGEYILIKIDGNNVTFGNSAYGAMMAPLSGLKLSKQGVIKEFPDLSDNIEWHNIAISRFRDKIHSLKTEEDKAKYIIEDLEKFGYMAKYMQKAGFRRVNL